MRRMAGRPRKRPSYEEFYNLYSDKTKTIKELCIIWGVKKQTIYQWSTYYNKLLNKTSQ